MSDSTRRNSTSPAVLLGALSLAGAAAVALWARNQGNSPAVSVATGWTLVVLILAVSAVLRVAWSLMAPARIRSRRIFREERSVRALRQEKSRVLRALKELEFDYELRKISTNDFEVIRDQYRLRAVELNRLLAGSTGRHSETIDVLSRRGTPAKQSVASTEIST